MESLVRRCASSLRSYGWGVSQLQIDSDLLQTGKFAVSACRGILADGTSFDLLEESGNPLVRELAEDVADNVIYLAVPVLHAGGVDVELDGADNGAARYLARETEVRDGNNGSGSSTQMQIGEPRFRLLLERDELSGHHCLGLARIVQVSADKNVILDDGFIPPCLDCRDTVLGGFVNELEGLLHQRGEKLAERVSGSGHGSAAEFADFLWLQVINRFEPLVAHLTRSKLLHPEALYTHLLGLAGELATFATAERRPPAFPEYRHDALQATFAPVIDSLRRSLSVEPVERAVALPLEAREGGIVVAPIADRSLLGDAIFVLAVNADMPGETLRNSFPAQVKIGPVEKIRELVSLALPAIALRPLPVAPRQIPFYAGVTYFELDVSNPFWKELERSGGLAFHLAGKFPNLELQFWAIRK